MPVGHVNPSGAARRGRVRRALTLAAVWGAAVAAPAAILWSDLGSTLAHETGDGVDILGGALKRDNRATDTLYFKFHVDPLSDVSTEEYSAAFQLFEGETERLGVGNSLKAWAYSTFNTLTTGEFNKVFGDLDLKSARPESSSPGVFLPYELPRRGIENTIVFKVEYVPGEEDRVTVWLNPDLAAGATEAGQPAELTTTFRANCSFNNLRLRHVGGGGGWTFSEMAIATSFEDFVAAGDGAEAGAAERTPQLVFRAWQRDQGLPHNAVRALAQTPDGYLWLGSDEGVTRFDGINFASFGQREGLVSGAVRVLVAGRGGRLWIGTAGGGLAWRTAAGSFGALTRADGLPSDNITALLEEPDGRLWIGTEAGLVTAREGRIEADAALKEFQTANVSTLYRDRRGVIWVGATGMGLFRFVDGRFAPFRDAAVDDLLTDAHCVLEDRAGRLWIGAGDDFVLCREQLEWRRHRVPRHVNRPFVRNLVEQPDGTVWAGSVSEGLFQFRAGRLATLTASSGLADNFVEAMLVDFEGNLWAGTASGLNRVRRSKVVALGQKQGLGFGPVEGLAEIAPGHIWVCKPGDGLFRWRGRQFERVVVSEGSRRMADVRTLIVTRSGATWMATSQGLLRFLDPLADQPAPDATALPGRDVTALGQDAEGWVWAGTRDGQVWQQTRLAWLRVTNIAANRAITCFAFETNGAAWIGTDGEGVLRAGPEGIRAFRKAQGLLSDAVRVLKLDARGALWIGTAGGGLSRLAGGQLATLSMREGLPDDTVSQLFEDDAGVFWLGGNRGIVSVRRAELEQVAAGQARSVFAQVWGRAEGMVSEECSGGFAPAGLRTQSGLLWFPTQRGVAVVNPLARNMESPAPFVLLEDVLVDGVRAGLNPAELARPADEPEHAPRGPLTLELAPGRKRLEFHYTGLSFAAPERLRFRYKLEGLDPDWTEAEDRRVAFYSYVPPGNYRFRVAACSAEGVWNDAGTVLELKVGRYFWQSPWFYGLGLVGLAASIGGIVLLVEKRRHRARLLVVEAERAIERERTRIAQDLHDDLGSSLTRLSLLSDLVKEEKDHPEQVAARAVKISQSAAQTVRALEEIVWALRPGSDTLQSLVEYIAHFARELFEGDAARCRLDLPPDLPDVALPPEMRHNVFLIVKEALTNALKHAGARRVLVTAAATEQWLEITVADDGAGFAVPTSAAATARNGLGNIRRRAAAMNGEVTITSQPGAGTRVHLKVHFPPRTPSRRSEPKGTG